MKEPSYSSDTKGVARWRAMLLGCVAVMTIILVGWTLRASAPVVSRMWWNFPAAFSEPVKVLSFKQRGQGA
jgi:hypothetical protein